MTCLVKNCDGVQVLTRQRNWPSVQQRFGLTISVSANAAARSLLPSGNAMRIAGIWKKLQPALHNCIKHRLRVGRGVADQSENFGGGGQLLQRLFAFLDKTRHLRFLPGRFRTMTGHGSRLDWRALALPPFGVAPYLVCRLHWSAVALPPPWLRTRHR